MPKYGKHQLLVVEDEPRIRAALVDELTEAGFSILQAENGQQGLSLALTEKPDLILLDILMPVMDGLTMMKKLRESDIWGKKVPVILLTNLSAGEDRVLMAVAKHEPIYYFVKADWTPEGIVAKIKEHLTQHADTTSS